MQICDQKGRRLPADAQKGERETERRYAEYQTYRTFSYSEEYDNNQEITDLALTENLENLADAANGKLIADNEDPMEVLANFVTSIPKSFDPRYVFMILALVLFLTRCGGAQVQIQMAGVRDRPGF